MRLSLNLTQAQAQVPLLSLQITVAVRLRLFSRIWAQLLPLLNHHRWIDLLQDRGRAQVGPGDPIAEDSITSTLIARHPLLVQGLSRILREKDVSSVTKPLLTFPGFTSLHFV
ncbi:hypothetical protein BZA77DRAFT_308879 [Pyronema omphalodes]|nr:hypothetical protein BZA77DRAFT_308879 [Pyronema omphalodes]